MSARTLAMVGTAIAIAAIAAIAATTPGLPAWVAIVVSVLLVASVAITQVRVTKLARVVLDALRAKGPMTASQVATAIERPRLRVIAALAQLRAQGAVTRAPLEAPVPDGDPNDTHLYTVAA